MMRTALRYIMELVAFVHDCILFLNDEFGWNLADKELHFVVMGMIGCVVVVVLYPMLRRLHRFRSAMLLTWIHAFMIVAMLAISIEIGQGITHTGSMEFMDIIYGVFGFVAMSFLLYAVWILVHIAVSICRKCIRRSYS